MRLGEAGALVRSLSEVDVEAIYVPESGAGAAVAEAGLVVLEALAFGPGGLVAVSGSRAVAAVAAHAGVPVWAVAGEGRILPKKMWHALAARLDDGRDPWDTEEEVVPLDLVDEVVGSWGRGHGSGCSRPQ